MAKPQEFGVIGVRKMGGPCPLALEKGMAVDRDTHPGLDHPSALCLVVAASTEALCRLAPVGLKS
jgi:hypothetical protein